MLTEDLKLYHSGLAVPGITEAHSEFTQIFPEKSFYDIAYIGENLTGTGTNLTGTLIVTMEE